MVDIDFDPISEHIVQGEDFKSWNDDSNFKFNALYFQFTKPCKVEIQFWGDTNNVFGVVDLLLWPNSYYEVKLTQIRLEYERDSPKPATFWFYANPFFQGLGKGSFEPRVYNTGNISKIVVKKLLKLKEDDWSKYALFLIRRARDMYNLAIEKEKGQVYGLSLHFSRFCIELSLKSIFPMFKQFIPHKHDVSGQVSDKLRKAIARKSSDFARILPRLLWISQLHIKPDRLDFYGDPYSQAPPDLFVTQEEAKITLRDAGLCYGKCCELFEKVVGKT